VLRRQNPSPAAVTPPALPLRPAAAAAAGPGRSAASCSQQNADSPSAQQDPVANGASFFEGQEGRALVGEERVSSRAGWAAGRWGRAEGGLGEGAFGCPVPRVPPRSSWQQGATETAGKETAGKEVAVRLHPRWVGRGAPEGSRGHFRVR